MCESAKMIGVLTIVTITAPQMTGSSATLMPNCLAIRLGGPAVAIGTSLL